LCGYFTRELLDGRYLIEEDFKIGGEVLRVHKSDVVPYPSNPHAHCVGGKEGFVGCRYNLEMASYFDNESLLVVD
jgi:hypothetical protein